MYRERERERQRESSRVSVRDRSSISAFVAGVVCLNNTYSTRYYASLKNKCMFSLIAVAKVVTGTILMVVVEGYPLCTCTTCVYVSLCFELPVIHHALCMVVKVVVEGYPLCTCTTCVCQTLF